MIKLYIIFDRKNNCLLNVEGQLRSYANPEDAKLYKELCNNTGKEYEIKTGYVKVE